MTTTKGRESHVRSITKGITWRVIATSTIIGIAYFSTGNINLALEIGFIEFFVKILLYYLHERTWQRVPIGGLRKFLGIKVPKNDE